LEVGRKNSPCEEFLAALLDGQQTVCVPLFAEIFDFQFMTVHRYFEQKSSKRREQSNNLLTLLRSVDENASIMHLDLDRTGL